MGAVKPYPPISAVVVGVVTGLAVSVLGAGLGWPKLLVAFGAAFLAVLFVWAVVDRPRDKPDEEEEHAA